MLSPTKQQEIIINYDGNAVVIAAPGSGKTYVLSQKIKSNLKILQEHEGLIAISYTNKANYPKAFEYDMKALNAYKEAGIKKGMARTIDKFYISEIIIPFGKQIWGIPKDTIQVITIDSLPDIEKELFNWFKRGIKLDQLNNEQIKQLSRYFLNGIILIETIGLIANYVFDNSLACKNYIHSRYKYIYIDEYQDSGYEQHQLFLKINSLNIKAVAVGDLNQSIYAFSGKNSKYLEVLSRDSHYKYFVLNKNHRCHTSIINYSNYLLNSKTEIIPCSDKRVFYFCIDGNETIISQWIDNKVSALQKKFDVSDRNQIAILTRWNRTGDIFNASLKEKHKLFITPELDINLNVWSGLFSGLLYFIFDHDYKFIDAIEQFQLFSKIPSKAKEELLEIKKSFNVFINGTEKDYTKLEKPFFRIAQIVAPNSENPVSVQLLKDTLGNKNELQSYNPAGRDEINIMTLHKSKGLEFDIVIHLDLYEWVFPSKGPGLNNDFDNPIYGSWRQDLNLHYVGITRARKATILFSSTQRTNNRNEIKRGNPSEFILIQGINELRYKCT